MSIVRIDPEGRRNAEHIAIIVVVDLVPIQCHFRSRRPQAQQPLSQDGHTATGPAQDGHRPAAANDPVIGRCACIYCCATCSAAIFGVAG